MPFGAGSLTDVVPRVVFDQVSRQIGQTIVVENRTGAGGTIGVGAVVRAEPDGHTLLANSSAHTIAPAIYPNLAYDTARDLAAVISLGQTPMVMIMAPSRGHKAVHDYVKAAKANRIRSISLPQASEPRPIWRRSASSTAPASRRSTFRIAAAPKR